MERISGVKREDVLGKCAFDLFSCLKETGEDQYYLTHSPAKASSQKTVLTRFHSQGVKGSSTATTHRVTMKTAK